MNSVTFSGIDCGLLEAPKNGDISFSQGTLFGSVATYSCDIPYQIVGVVTRVCQTSGVWSGDAPFCESEFPVEILKCQYLNVLHYSSSL